MKGEGNILKPDVSYSLDAPHIKICNIEPMVVVLFILLTQS